MDLERHAGQRVEEAEIARCLVDRVDVEHHQDLHLAPAHRLGEGRQGLGIEDGTGAVWNTVRPVLPKAALRRWTWASSSGPAWVPASTIPLPRAAFSAAKAFWRHAAAGPLDA